MVCYIFSALCCARPCCVAFSNRACLCAGASLSVRPSLVGLEGCGPLTGEARGHWNEKLECFLAEAAVFKLKRQDMWEEKGYWQRLQRSLD